ncbi:MAG TPA: glycosyltransferase family 39 protein [Vicinamibacteria bacterium]|nr:glycosyltransferase family 39 protein [Vicinamibacteria bacterium]
MRDPASLAAHPLARRLVPPVLLAVMAGLLVTSSLHKRLVYDEYDNLSYGHRFLSKGPGVSPEGQRMPVLVLNAVACLPDGCELAAVNADEGERLGVRAGSMVFALGLAALIAAWAARLFGPVAGLAALWLAVFDPTLLAHGKQVTSDVAVAALMTAAVYAFWRWREAGQTGWLAAATLATAAALLSKLTALLLLPIFGGLLAVEAIHAWRAGRRPTAASVARGIALAAAAALTVLFLVNAAYGFRGTLRLAGSHAWKSRLFQEHVRAPVPIPLPRVFVQSLDYSSYLQENPELARGYNYLLGELNRDGRWYAFPLMVLLKTPLALLVLAAMGLRAPRPSGLVPLLAIPFAAVMLVFSLAVDPQLGIRYVLPALPFLTLAAARGASFLDGRRRWVVPVLLGWQAVSVLSYTPHYVPYFNELIGRRVNAYRYLADSNLDWEDHRYWIAAFQRRHPERHVQVDPPGPRRGWILVGANDLVGIFEPERYRWLREGYSPVAHVAYAHLLFHVSGTPQQDEGGEAE